MQMPYCDRYGATARSSCASEICLGSGTTAGPWIERTRRPAPQRFRQELLIRRGNGAGADVGRGLGAFVWRLVVVELSLHVDAINGIIDAVLNVPEVTHENCLRRYRSARTKNARWRTPLSGCLNKLNPESKILKSPNS